MKKLIFLPGILSIFIGMAQATKNVKPYNGKIVNDSIYSDWQGWVPKSEYDKYNYELYAMPGIGLMQYNWTGQDSVGTYPGFSVEILLWSKVHQNNDFGPSHVKLYSKLNLNRSKQEGMGRLFYYAMGIQLSIEKNPKRHYLIPFFGGEIGGMSQKQLGTTAVFFPEAGLYLLATKNIYINLYGGYLYPVRNIDYLSGYSLQASINFALW